MHVISTERIPIKLWLDDIEDGALAQAKNLAEKIRSQGTLIWDSFRLGTYKKSLHGLLPHTKFNP